jgi:HEAT repeat protein
MSVPIFLDGMTKRLHKGDETLRRWAIIDVSRRGDKRYLDQLMARLDSDETYENKRHIVRALGNLGDSSVVDRLIKLAVGHNGLILGDIAHSLGQLRASKAKPLLEKLASHKLTWVQQNARFALDQLSKRKLK